MPDNVESLSPELAFTEEQSREFDRLLELRTQQGMANSVRYSDGRKVDITKISLDLSSGQIRLVPNILYRLTDKWDPIYQIHMGDILSTDPETLAYYRSLLPKKITDDDVLNERDLSTDERYAVFWGFHSRDTVLNQRANSIVLYENLGTIKKRLLGDVINKKDAYSRRSIYYRTDSSVVTPTDYFNEVVKDLYLLFDRYDIRRDNYFNTIFTGSISATIKRVQRFEHPLGVNADDQRMFRRVQQALDDLGNDADDLSVYQYLQDKWPGIQIDSREVRRAMKSIQEGFGSFVSIDKVIGDEEDGTFVDVIRTSASSEGFRNPEAEVIERDRIEDLLHSIRMKLERMSRVMLTCILEVYELEGSGKMGQAEMDRLIAGKKPTRRKLTTMQRIKKGAMRKFMGIYRDASDNIADVFYEKVANVVHAEVLRFVSSFESRKYGKGVAAAMASLDNFDDTYRLFAEDSIFEMNKSAWTAEKENIVEMAEIAHENDPDPETDEW